MHGGECITLPLAIIIVLFLSPTARWSLMLVGIHAFMTCMERHVWSNMHGVSHNYQSNRYIIYRHRAHNKPQDTTHLYDITDKSRSVALVGDGLIKIEVGISLLATGIPFSLSR